MNEVRDLTALATENHASILVKIDFAVTNPGQAEKWVELLESFDMSIDSITDSTIEDYHPSFYFAPPNTHNPIIVSTSGVIESWMVHEVFNYLASRHRSTYQQREVSIRMFSLDGKVFLGRLLRHAGEAIAFETPNKEMFTMPIAV